MEGLFSGNSWFQFEEGHSIGQTGSEDGVILRDEEHVDGARVTLESVNPDRFWQSNSNLAELSAT